jgi:hypothetical protein
MKGKTTTGRSRKGMLNDLVGKLYGIKKGRQDMSGGAGCQGPTVRMKTEEEYVAYTVQ